MKNENYLIPTIIQDFKTKQVLMLGFMNKDALNKTQKTGDVYFWSRSRNMLWEKGKTSGNRLKVKEIFFDCDKDTLLVKAEIIGNAVCHKGTISCFTERIL